MTQPVPPEVLEAFARIPEGASTGFSDGRRYIVAKTSFNGGKSVKLLAEELGGTDYISCNLYFLESGARLYPCEMPVEKVIRFVVAFRPAPAQVRSS